MGTKSWTLEHRVRIWDRALHAARQALRGRGMHEVVTDLRQGEVALEPYIEPVAAPPGWLVTSPELALKRMMCQRVGSVFQIAHVWRGGEAGTWHRGEFRLLEWYRAGETTDRLMRDVEAVCSAVVEAVTSYRDPGFVDIRAYRREAFLDLVEQLAGLQLRGDEDADALAAACAGSAVGALGAIPAGSTEMGTLAAWTAFFTLFSDRFLDPWIQGCTGAGEGVHIVEFPVPLHALAHHEVDASGRQVAARFETYGWGVELCNGYGELRDGTEQRRRFEVVAELRRAQGLPDLPMPEAFLAALDGPGLPGCAGAALGLDRLVALAVGAPSLEAIALDDPGL